MERGRTYGRLLAFVRDADATPTLKYTGGMKGEVYNHLRNQGLSFYLSRNAGSSNVH